MRALPCRSRWRSAISATLQFILLNPLAESSDGEWQAWFFSNWNPGAVRYRSFQQMIENERKRFLLVRDHKR